MTTKQKLKNGHRTHVSKSFFNIRLFPLPAALTRVEMRYNPRNPYDVAIAFPACRPRQTGWVEWVFDRDTLAKGILADIHATQIELEDPEGNDVIEALTQTLSDFLDRTYKIVIPGNEFLWE